MLFGHWSFPLFGHWFLVIGHLPAPVPKRRHSVVRLLEGVVHAVGPHGGLGRRLAAADPASALCIVLVDLCIRVIAEETIVAEVGIRARVVVATAVFGVKTVGDRPLGTVVVEVVDLGIGDTKGTMPGRAALMEFPWVHGIRAFGMSNTYRKNGTNEGRREKEGNGIRIELHSI